MCRTTYFGLGDGAIYWDGEGWEETLFWGVRLGQGEISVRL